MANRSRQVKKGRWIPEEDEKLIRYMETKGIKELHGQKSRGFWPDVPELAGLNRCGRSCWLRWTEHLKRSGMKKGKFSEKEENTILVLRANKFGGKNKWSDIAKDLPDRTANEIKNHWHNHLKKKQKKLIVKKDNIIHHTDPISYSTGLEGLGFGYINITPNPNPNPNPNPMEPQLRYGVLPLPLPSQGPSSFNDLTMEHQFDPFPITGSISINPKVHNNYPVDVGSVPVEELTDNLWPIPELHGLGINSTIPAQANQQVFTGKEQITPDEKACLEFAEQQLMNDDTYTDDLSSDHLDSWIKALISV